MVRQRRTLDQICNVLVNMKKESSMRISIANIAADLVNSGDSGRCLGCILNQEIRIPDL